MLAPYELYVVAVNCLVVSSADVIGVRVFNPVSADFSYSHLSVGDMILKAVLFVELNDLRPI